MIDIHAHILPALDDGPVELGGSLALAKAAVSGGTQIMAATPHTLNGLYLNRRVDVIGAVGRLQAIFNDADIPLRLVPGADVALSPELIHSIDSGEVTTLNDGGKYLLVELPPFFSLPKIHELIFELETRGVTPVISHPERDRNIFENPGWLEGFIERGCLSQVTAMSLMGGFGKKIKAFAERLLDHDLIHIIASDCHSAENRGPEMRTAVTEAAKFVGEEKASAMVEATPEAILDGREVAVPQPVKMKNKKRGWFWSAF